MFPIFKSAVEGAIISGLRNNLRLNMDGRFLISHKDAVLLKWIIENNYILEHDLKHAVHEGICKNARNAYELYRNDTRLRPDDSLCCPPAFAYGIVHRAISATEVSHIKFDHGETLQEFCGRADGLLESVMDQLRSAPMLPKVVSSNEVCCEDGHCCC